MPTRTPTRLSVDPLGTPPPLLPWIDRNTASPMGSSKLADMDAGEEVLGCSTTRLRFVAEVDVAAWRRLDLLGACKGLSGVLDSELKDLSLDRELN